MPQIIAAIIAIIVLVWVVAVIVWMVQWLVASVIWLFQAILLPAVIFLFPALIGLVVLAGLVWGAWIAAKNYLESIKAHVNPMGALRGLVRGSVIFSQSLTLLVVCSVSLIMAGAVLYEWSLLGVEYVKGYYESIVFPVFKIIFPFWA